MIPLAKKHDVPETVLNPHTKEGLLEILFKVEFSSDSTAGRLLNYKHCPYCYSRSTHEHDCELNNVLLLLMMHDLNCELKECVHQVLRKVEWKGAMAPTCPNCESSKSDGHSDDCFYNFF